jgi:hypothetical protein
VFKTTFRTVLVRHKPESEPPPNLRRAAHLKWLSDGLHRGIKGAIISFRSFFLTDKACATVNQ